MTCYIFGGAEIFDYSGIHVPDDAFVIAADRGYMHCERLGIIPRLIVGDLDSIETDVPEKVRLIKAPREKDDTDLIMAVRSGIDAGCSDFHIYGGDGGRMGHTFANIQTLSLISSMGYTGTIHGGCFDMTLQPPSEREYLNKGYSYVSLFSLSEYSELAVRGLKYSGRFMLRRNYPMGVSNEFSEERCSISVIDGEILVILEK